MLATTRDTDYANPEVLVSTEWVEAHHEDPDIRIAEVDYDPVSSYNQGHVPDAVLFDWKKDLNDSLARDILSKAKLEDLLGRNGIAEATWIVLYGDLNNWFAAYAFWVLRYYGVTRVKLMNGGRKKWLLEDRPISRETPSFGRVKFTASDPSENLRAYKEQVKDSLSDGDKILVDVRSPKEFTGEILAPPEYPSEHAQRGGHIPGAVNVPWGLVVNESDGTFKGRQELDALYNAKGVKAEKEVITYCRIGERSSHTWFVLKYLLGYPKVRNYDGSWTEWGNSVRLPVER